MPTFAEISWSSCRPRNRQYPHSMSAYSTIVTGASAGPAARWLVRSIRLRRSARGSPWKSHSGPARNALPSGVT